MAWGAVAGAAVGLIGGALSSSSASSAADAQAAGSAASIAEQKRQYDLTRSDYAPYRTTGGSALNMLARTYGLDTYNPNKVTTTPGFNVNGLGGVLGGGSFNIPGTSSTTGGVNPGSGHADLSGFFTSPDYNFRRSEGDRGILQSAAARGGLGSGNALKALSEYNSNLASGEYGNWFNRLAGIAGIGQSATQGGAYLGQQSANNIGNSLQNQGDARASGILGASNGWINSLNSGINTGLAINRYQNPGYGGGYGGGGG